MSFMKLEKQIRGFFSIYLFNFFSSGESQTPPKRGRSAKRGRPFSKNLPGRAESMTSKLIIWKYYFYIVCQQKFVIDIATLRWKSTKSLSRLEFRVLLIFPCRSAVHKFWFNGHWSKVILSVDKNLVIGPKLLFR